jgi:tryptophan synthase alpha chain
VLESYLDERLKERQVLLMTHLVVGYPTFEASFDLLTGMLEAGVDLVELQIPFSEPIADGPVILKANAAALAAGATVQRCLEFGERAAAASPVPLLFMSYYNILYKFGVRDFVAQMARIGVAGAIVPDLPYEEGAEYLSAMSEFARDPIFICSPNTSEARLANIAEHARGFVYCVARKGVTGSETRFSEELGSYLERCRRAIRLPLAVGFGVKSGQDVEFLRGRADIAVVGSETLRAFEHGGVPAAIELIRSLRTSRASP